MRAKFCARAYDCATKRVRRGSGEKRKQNGGTYLSEPTAQLIRKMDLSAVAEFKRNGNGTVEVKFVDRVKALSALYDMLGGGDADEAAEFLQALEQAGEEKDDWRA